jgi:uroporphyrinogen decarboxylase
MFQKERVLAAIMGYPYDVVPTGELNLDVETCSDIRCDCIGVDIENPSNISYFKSLNLFIWGIVNGPFMNLTKQEGLEKALIKASKASILRNLSIQSLNNVKKAKELGVDGIILCDDVAYSMGPYFPPTIFETFFCPSWVHIVTEAHSQGYPIFFHSDGMVEPIIGHILHCGFDGLHSLDPEAGVEISRIRHVYGETLCLMGGLGLSILLNGSSEEITLVSQKLVLTGGRKYIFGTAVGFLPEWVPKDHLALAYCAARGVKQV